jgi:hypothetical protein
MVNKYDEARKEKSKGEKSKNRRRRRRTMCLTWKGRSVRDKAGRDIRKHNMNNEKEEDK